MNCSKSKKQVVKKGSQLMPILTNPHQENLQMAPISFEQQVENEIKRDPELWWKERQKKMSAAYQMNWQGIQGVTSSSLKRKHTFFHGLLVRFFICLLLLGGFLSWLKFQFPGSEEARAWLRDHLSENIDFETIEAWYYHTFSGFPSFLPFGLEQPEMKEVNSFVRSQTALPLDGKIIQPYNSLTKKMKIAAPSESGVHVIFKGQVKQIKRNTELGITIWIEHENQLISVYEGLETGLVKRNDWLETGQLIGRLAPTSDGDSESILTFWMEQKGTTVNPTEVVSFD